MDFIFVLLFASIILYVLNYCITTYGAFKAFKKAQTHCTYGMHIDEIRNIMGSEWLEREGYVQSGNYVLEYRFSYRWSTDYEFVRFIFDQNNRMCNMARESRITYYR